MASIAGNDFGRALDHYVKLFSNPNQHSLTEIAQETVKLDKLAHSVINTASPRIRSTAVDLERLLQSQLSKDVSILTASEHYLENPSNAELGELIRDLCHNQLALRVMHQELSILSGDVKNPNAPVG